MFLRFKSLIKIIYRGKGINLNRYFLFKTVEKKKEKKKEGGVEKKKEENKIQ